MILVFCFYILLDYRSHTNNNNFFVKTVFCLVGKRFSSWVWLGCWLLLDYHKDEHKAYIFKKFKHFQRNHVPVHQRIKKKKRINRIYLGGANLTGRNAHLFTMSQLNREDNLVVAGSYRSDQILIFPVLFEQLLHVAYISTFIIGVQIRNRQRKMTWAFQSDKTVCHLKTAAE